MQRKTRLAVLFTALAAAGAWAAFGGKNAEVVTAAAPAKAVAPEVVLAAAASPSPQESADMPARPSLEKMGSDPFNVDVPQQAPQAPPPAPVHSAPPPPPMPYRFAGRLQIGDAMEVYLAKGDEVIEVKKGDKLDGQYRVEKIGRTEMTLVHLASGAREKLEYSPPITEDESAVVETPKPQKAVRAKARDYGALRGTTSGS